MIDPFDSTTLYAGGSGGAYKSTDGGAHWTEMGLYGVATLAIDPHDSSIIYAGEESYCCGGVYKTTDAGAHWTDVGLYGVAALAIDPLDSSVIYAGLIDFLMEDIYRTDGVFKSTDGGVSWKVANAGLGNTPVITLAIDPTTPWTLYAGSYLGGLDKSTDGGATWTYSGLGGSIDTLAIDPAHPSTLYATVSGETMDWSDVYTTIDGGGSWKRISGLVYTEALVIDPRNSSTLYAASDHYGVFKSLDGGIRWSFSGLEGFYFGALVVDPRSPTTLYAGTGDGVYKTIDGGGSWSAANAGLIGTFVASLAIDPADSSTLYAGTRGRVYTSTDGGANWRAFNTGLPDAYLINALAIDPITPSTLYAGTGGWWVGYSWGDGAGVYKSQDGGVDWTALNTGLTNLDVRSLVIDPFNSSILYAGTDGNGVFEITQTEPCVADATTLCIDDQPGDLRFKITLHYDTALGGGLEGDALAIPLTPLGITDGGILSFFDPANPEVLIKVLNGCGFNDRFWVFYAATTTVGFALTVEDTQTGIRKVYTNPERSAAVMVADSTAFDTCGDSASGGESWASSEALLLSPQLASGARHRAASRLRASNGALDKRSGGAVSLAQVPKEGGCVADATTLCIDDRPGDRRFKVTLRFDTALGGGLEGDAVATSLAPLGITAGGVLSFFDPANPEVLIKVLNGCGFNDRLWVFYAAATSVGFALTVEDTQNGSQRLYTNPDMHAASTVTDTGAFETCP